MPKTIISDTSCLIVLANTGELNLLQKVYGQIATIVEIASEFGEPLPDWFEILTVADKFKQLLLELRLDSGESSAIALALETPESVVILDDYQTRKIANRLGHIYTGTIGVIIKAKLIGVIPSIKPFIKKIRQSNFRLSTEIELQALIEANEL